MIARLQPNPDYPVGTQFIKLVPAKPKAIECLCTVLDYLVTTNMAGDIVATEYLVGHDFLGKTITEKVYSVTIARGIARLNGDPA